MFHFDKQRFLFRLSKTPEGHLFVLKGGIMFWIWYADVSRPTRDLDLLSRVTNDIHELSRVMAYAGIIACEEDGVFLTRKVSGQKK